MSLLSILTNWRSTELCINIVPVEFKKELESIHLKLIKLTENEFPEIENVDISFEDIWYKLEDYRQWLSQIGIITANCRGRGIGLIEYCGPSFSDLDEIYKVISNKHDSKKIEILVNGMEISTAYLWEKCIFQEMVKTQLKQNELTAYHGGTSWAEMAFELDIDEPFEKDKLVFIFTDCGKHGYILNSIMYNREEMEKDYDPFKESFFDLRFFNRNHEIVT